MEMHFFSMTATILQHTALPSSRRKLDTGNGDYFQQSHQQKWTKCRGIKYTNWPFFSESWKIPLLGAVFYCCNGLPEYFIYLFQGTQAFIMITRVGDIISNLHKKLIMSQLN